MPADVHDPRPPPPSWLDKEFIQTALRTGNNDTSIVVLSCELSMATAMGDGYLSNMYRVIAKLQDGKEYRLIAKCQPQGGKQEEMIHKLSAYDKETWMYTETLPAMHRLLEQAGIYDQLTPKCFYHGSDPVPFLVLEDLRHAGFSLNDVLKGLDMDHCKLVMKCLARFHASSMVLRHQQPKALDKYDDIPFSENLRSEFEPMLVNSVLLLEKAVLKWPGYEKYSKKLSVLRENLYDRLMDIVKRKEGKFNSLVHGDLWTNNIMFKYLEDVVKDVRILDFQTIFHSSLLLDVQFFLKVCLNEEARGQTDSLLKDYHRILTDTLDKLHYRECTITFEELKKEFDDYTWFGFVMIIGFFPFIPTDATRNVQVDDIINATDAVKDNVECLLRDDVLGKIIKGLLVTYGDVGIF